MHPPSCAPSLPVQKAFEVQMSGFAARFYFDSTLSSVAACKVRHVRGSTVSNPPVSNVTIDGSAVRVQTGFGPTGKSTLWSTLTPMQRVDLMNQLATDRVRIIEIASEFDGFTLFSP